MRLLYVDVPTRPDINALNQVRADACVSIYLQTTPLTQDVQASVIALGNMAKQAREQLEAANFDKRRLAALQEHLDDLADDEHAWRFQAHSLAVLATPDTIQTFRLANRLMPSVSVADRFHLKPLLRAVTFANSAFVLALSENAVRLVEVHADLPAETIKVDGLPKDAASAVGKSSLNDRAPVRRIQGSEGQNLRLAQYARQVDAAVRSLLVGRETPLILAATGRLASIYRSVNSYPNLLAQGIDNSPDRMTDAELADLARPVLDAANQAEITAFRELYEARVGEGRASSDIAICARAATYGAIDTLLVDIDAMTPGVVDEQTGAVRFADEPDVNNYGVIDEIASRALRSGARVLGVRADDLPSSGGLAAALRYTV